MTVFANPTAVWLTQETDAPEPPTLQQVTVAQVRDALWALWGQGVRAHNQRV